MSDLETVRAHRNQLCDWLEVPRPQLVAKVSWTCVSGCKRSKRGDERHPVCCLSSSEDCQGLLITPHTHHEPGNWTGERGGGPQQNKCDPDEQISHFYSLIMKLFKGP